MESESKLLEALPCLYGKVSDKVPSVFGVDHVKEVALFLKKALLREDQKINTADARIAIAAALFHEVPYFTPQGADGQREDSFRDILSILKRLLSCVGRPNSHGERLEHLARVILEVNSTERRFPNELHSGDIIYYPYKLKSDSLTRATLLLREADGIAHVESKSVEAAIKLWRKAEIPWAPDSGILSTWKRDVSIVGNLRLLEKRMFIDSFTEYGEHAAVNAYHRIERIIKEICIRQDKAYAEEVIPVPKLLDYRKQTSVKNFRLQIVRYESWTTLSSMLRTRVTLKHNRSVYPYRNAIISSRVVTLDHVSPMAMYVVKKRLEEVQVLNEAFMIGLGSTLYDLPGLLFFTFNTDKVQPISAPIVEQYNETSPKASTGGSITGLVDGLHRCYVAKTRYNLKKVRVIFIQNASAPLVPLPVTWSDVIEYDSVPHPSRKRKYRCERIDDCPTDRYSGINESNYDYFFFRDLTLVGSEGKRTFNEFDEAKRTDGGK